MDRIDECRINSNVGRRRTKKKVGALTASQKGANNADPHVYQVAQCDTKKSLELACLTAHQYFRAVTVSSACQTDTTASSAASIKAAICFLSTFITCAVSKRGYANWSTLVLNRAALSCRLFRASHRQLGHELRVIDLGFGRS